MNLLRRCLLLVALLTASFAPSSHAEMPMLNKHLGKLLGTWKSEQGAVVSFSVNRTIVYKGRRYIGAIAPGTIQIKKRKGVVVHLPYRLQGGKLFIRDNGVETVYVRIR
jgi:hypothetical protein